MIIHTVWLKLLHNLLENDTWRHISLSETDLWLLFFAEGKVHMFYRRGKKVMQ